MNIKILRSIERSIPGSAPARPQSVQLPTRPIAPQVVVPAPHLQSVLAQSSNLGVANAAIFEGAARIEELSDLVYDYHSALHDEYSALTPSADAPCQSSVRGARCRCAECRRSRYLTLEAKAEALGITR